jgi:hypothetical protein
MDVTLQGLTGAYKKEGSEALLFEIADCIIRREEFIKRCPEIKGPDKEELAELLTCARELYGNTSTLLGRLRTGRIDKKDEEIISGSVLFYACFAQVHLDRVNKIMKKYPAETQHVLECKHEDKREEAVKKAEEIMTMTIVDPLQVDPKTVDPSKARS